MGFDLAQYDFGKALGSDSLFCMRCYQEVGGKHMIGCLDKCCLIDERNQAELELPLVKMQ